MSVRQSEQAPDQEKQIYDLTVFAPRSTQPKPFAWDKHSLVGTDADVAATAFSYSGGTPSLALGNRILDRNKQLVAEGVRDGDQLDLVDTGGGV
jgi:hypothetical protein